MPAYAATLASLILGNKSNSIHISLQLSLLLQCNIIMMVTAIIVPSPKSLSICSLNQTKGMLGESCVESDDEEE